MSDVARTLIANNANQIANAAMNGILSRARRIPGLVYNEELVLLVLAAIEAAQIPNAHMIVEIGSYLGRSTSALARALDLVDASHMKVIAVDPHLGRMRADEPDSEDTFAAFAANLKAAGVADRVTPVRRASSEVHIEGGVGLLFIDALHDYDNVKADLAKHYPAVVPGGLVAFHDYSIHHPGVVRCVDEAVSQNKIRQTGRAGSLYLARKI